MADQTTSTEVRITGDAAGATAAMRQAADAVKKGVGDMQGVLGSLGGAFEKVHGLFGNFVTLIAGAGVAAINQMVEAFADSVEATRDVARNLGITTNEVAGLDAALDDVGASMGEYEAAAKGMLRQLQQNEQAMQSMGLQTRDASGSLRPLNDLMVDAIAVLNTYKESTDRNIAARELFGRGISASSRLLLINRETIEANRQAAEELGLVVGGHATAAWDEFDKASDRAGLSVKAFGKAVGETAMPAVTTLTNWFNNIAPAAITVVRGAIGGLVTAFLGLATGVRVVWEVINAFVISVAEPILALGRALTALAQGDFKGAADAIRSVPATIAGAWETAFAKILQSATETRDQLARIWGTAAGDVGGIGDSGATAGTRSAPRKEEKGAGGTAAAKETSRMGDWEATLAERKVAFQKENDLREMSKADELAYWQAITAMADINGKERVALRRKVANVELEVLKEQRAREVGLTEEGIQAVQQARLDGVEAVRQEMQHKVDMGVATKEEMLAIERDLEVQRAQIMRDAIEERIALLATDPTKNAIALLKLNDEIAAIERDHLMRMRGISNQAQQEQMKDWQGLFNGIGNAFGNVVTGLVAGTMSMGQAVRALFAGLLQSVASFLGQIVAKKMASWAAEQTIDSAKVASNAGVAGSGAAAAMADIPFVGPVLALAAMAAVFAAVMGLRGKSAAGGYDIPSGVNPMTQLHQEEMVLPARYANVIRDLAAQRGQGDDKAAAPAPAAPPTIELRGVSAGDFFIAARSDLAKVLNAMRRDNVLV